MGSRGTLGGSFFSNCIFSKLFSPPGGACAFHAWCDCLRKSLPFLSHTFVLPLPRHHVETPQGVPVWLRRRNLVKSLHCIILSIFLAFARWPGSPNFYFLRKSKFDPSSFKFLHYDETALRLIHNFVILPSKCILKENILSQPAGGLSGLLRRPRQTLSEKSICGGCASA